jgi:Protein of unknown function (DUF3667)
MTLKPGESIVEYIAGKRIIYQQPLAYLAVGFMFYFLMSEYIYAPHQLETGTLHKTEKLELGISLAIISLIAYAFVGRPKLNFIEISAAVGYIYGTAFIMAPLVILLQIPLHNIIDYIPKRMRFTVVDVPLLAITIYMSLSVCKAASLSTVRLLIPIIFSLLLFVQGIGLI